MATTRLATYAPWSSPAVRKINPSSYVSRRRFAVYDWYDVKPPLPPTNVVLSPNPATDTIRGGAIIAITSNVIIVDPSQDVSFKQQTLPSGWSASNSGSGKASPNVLGTLLSSGPLANSSTSVQSSSGYVSFDATLNLDVLLPPTAPSSLVNCCTFTFQIDSKNYTQIRCRKWSNIDKTAVYVDTFTSFYDGVVSGGGLLLSASSNINLEIVRWQNYVYLFVNSQLLYTTNRFGPFTTLGGQVSYSSSPGYFNISCDNGANSLKTSSKLYELTIRSNCLILDKTNSLGLLFQDKKDLSPRRITGIVPPTTLSEVGSHDIIVFGPWGFADLPKGFQYTLPPGKTIGSGINNTTLTLYSDPDVIN